MMPRFPVGLMAICLVIPVTLAAQTPPAPVVDTGNVTLLDATVHPGEFEPHTLFLQRGIVYRVSFSGPNIQIKMRSYKHKELPFVVALTNDVDATGGSEYELYPQSDGDVEFSAVDIGGKVPVTFRLWRVARATERGRRSSESGYWKLGIEGVIGWHPDYLALRSLQVRSGASYGLCLGVQDGHGAAGRLNGCIAGIEELTGAGSRPMTSLVTEPRFRISDAGRTTEFGVVGRAMLPLNSEAGVVYGLGAYAGLNLRPDPKGRGWRFTLVARVDRLHTSYWVVSSQSFNRATTWPLAVHLGIGRYF